MDTSDGEEVKTEEISGEFIDTYVKPNLKDSA
jgi:hypothetical protein